MIILLIWIQLVESLVIPTEPQKDRYVVREHKFFEMDCNHKLGTETRVRWEYISTHDNNNRSETIYDSQQPNNILKSGFDFSCQPHEASISTCTLQLVQARKNDSGKYICYVGQANETKFDSSLLKPITEIELVVRGPIYKTVITNNGDSVNLPCEHNIKNLTRARWSHVSLQGITTYSLFHMPAKETTNANYEAMCELHELSCNLKILQANKESAGRYICLVGESLEFEEKYGLDQMTHFIEIQLVIGELECNRNMNKSLTLIGENDCYGIEADVLNLKCSFNYFGNINYHLLHLRWIEKYKFNSLENKLNSSLIKHETNKISIQTNLSVAYEMQNSVFQCVLDDTKVKPCQLNEFKAQYVRNATENHPAINSYELQNKMCTANKSANVQCLYYWVHETPGTILDNPFLPVENMKSPGIYTCFAKCQLASHKDDCFIKAMEFKIVEGSQMRSLMIGLIIGLILILSAIIILYVYLKKKLFLHKPKQNKNTEQYPLPEDEENKRIFRKVISDYNLSAMKNILHEEKSKHHHIKIYESTQNGKVFMLDGAIWVTEIDSWNKKALIYPLISHEGAKHVLVIGGGDGVVARYLLENLEVESVTVYEIDERIIQLSRKYFPSLACSLDDPKVKIHIGDINDYMKSWKNAFDVIIIRSTSVKGEYLAKEYYEVIKKALKNGGVVSLTVTGNHKEYVTQYDVMEMFEMDFCNQIFPVVQYFYFPIQEHPDSVTRCIMCSLNPEMDFMHLYEMVWEGTQDKMEQVIGEIFEGCNSSRINFIARILKKKNIHTTEDLKNLYSNDWESLIGLTDVEVNKIKEFFERDAQEALVIALKDAHVSRKYFFVEVFRENLDSIAFKHLDYEYVVDSLKLLTRAEISKIKEIAERELKGICLYSDWKDSFTKDFMRSPLKTCSWLHFELMEALKRFSDDEIDQIKSFTSRCATTTFERIFEGLDSSRIIVIKSVFKQYGISGVHSLKLHLKLLEKSDKLSASELHIIKSSYKKWQKMTVEEVFDEIFGTIEDIRIRSLIEASKKFKNVHMAEEFIDLIKWTTNLYAFDFDYDELTKMKKCFEKTLQESVAEALKESGLLRINFVLKALSRHDLGSACRFIYYGDLEKSHVIFPNPLNILQELSETEISKIMEFHHKSLTEVIKEIMEGYDGSRIDFVTKILNKYGIRRQTHLFRYSHKLEIIEEFTVDEVNQMKAFIVENKNVSLDLLLKKLGIIDEKRITFILRVMEDQFISTSFELLNYDWSFFDNFMGLRDSEVKKLKEFIQTKKMIIDETIKKIFKEWDSSRIYFIRRTLKKEGILTNEDLQFLDSNDLEDLRGLTGDVVNKIKDFIEEGATSESKIEDLNLV